MYVDMRITLWYSSPHAMPEGREQLNQLLDETAAGTFMMKVAMA